MQIQLHDVPEELENAVRETIKECGAVEPLWFSDGAKRYFIINDSDAILGVVNIRPNMDNQHVRTWAGNIEMIIKPEYRGQGCGKATLKLALKKCKEIGLKQVLLTNIGESESIEHLILSCGAVLERVDIKDSIKVSRYWVEV